MEPDYILLKRLGLSKLGIACYQFLIEHQSHARVTLIAEYLGANRTNLYRTLAELEAHGFLRSYKAETIYYSAEPLRHALAALHERERRMLNYLILQQERLR
jgi:sugar-specific transcriptional regulator TrmB